MSARVCEGFAEDESEEGVDRAPSAFAACASLGFAGGISVCFAEESTPGETFQMLPDLDERVETRWLVAGKLDERYVLREEGFERF